jgi:hypothetical protein
VTNAGCRIRSVRPKGRDSARLLVFPDTRKRDRDFVLRIITNNLDAHTGGIAGFAFVVWDNSLASSAELRCSLSGQIPSIAMPEFIKNRVMATKVMEWVRE